MSFIPLVGDEYFYASKKPIVGNDHEITNVQLLSSSNNCQVYDQFPSMAMGTFIANNCFGRLRRFRSLFLRQALALSCLMCY